MNITERLFELQDQKYGDFQSNLSPNLKRETIIGVRVPELRKLAKEIRKEGAEKEFLEKLPHEYFEENLLHSILLGDEKEYGLCLDYVEKFLPYIDNWAVCDTLSPKVFKKHKEDHTEGKRKLSNYYRTERIPEDTEAEMKQGDVVLLSFFLHQLHKYEKNQRIIPLIFCCRTIP